LRGYISFARNTRHACVVKNISEGGACLNIGLLLDPAERFTLTVSAVGNFRRECRLIWRSDSNVGIQFVRMPAQDWHC
jgi:hypothetical protein